MAEKSKLGKKPKTSKSKKKQSSRAEPVAEHMMSASEMTKTMKSRKMMRD